MTQRDYLLLYFLSATVNLMHGNIVYINMYIL